jgi:hypothetical protein
MDKEPPHYNEEYNVLSQYHDLKTIGLVKTMGKIQ